MTPPVRPSSVGIVGLGLMGGSLARALKALPDPPRIVASSLEGADLDRAVEEGVVDEARAEAAGAARGVELVVYAAPLGATLDLVREHAGSWGGAVVTDLVSLKAPVLEVIRELGAGARYVGSHPMAGGEGRGFGAAGTGLFRGADVWLVRGDAQEEAGRTVEALWTALGARTRWIGAVDHDRRMVRASHLPQLLANALAAVLADGGLAPEDLGPGGRDMTRLAASSPDMWGDLLHSSGPELARAARELALFLEEAASSLEGGDVEAVLRLMERTGQWSRGGRGGEG